MLRALNLKRTLAMQALIQKCWDPVPSFRPGFRTIVKEMKSIRQMKARRLTPAHRRAHRQVAGSSGQGIRAVGVGVNEVQVSDLEGRPRAALVCICPSSAPC